MSSFFNWLRFRRLSVSRICYGAGRIEKLSHEIKRVAYMIIRDLKPDNFSSKLRKDQYEYVVFEDEVFRWVFTFPHGDTVSLKCVDKNRQTVFETKSAKFGEPPFDEVVAIHRSLNCALPAIADNFWGLETYFNILLRASRYEEA